MAGSRTQTSRTQAERLRDVEDYAIRHGEILGDLTRRVSEVENVQHAQELRDVKAEGQWEAVLKTLSLIDRRVEKIEGSSSRALWIVIGAVLLSVTAFVLKGGLIL